MKIFEFYPHNNIVSCRIYNFFLTYSYFFIFFLSQYKLLFQKLFFLLDKYLVLLIGNLNKERTNLNTTKTVVVFVRFFYVKVV